MGELKGNKVADVCQVTCKTCNPGSDGSTSVKTGSSGKGPLDAGFFKLAIPFSPSELKKNGAVANLQFTLKNHAITQVVVPLSNGTVDMGMVFISTSPPQPISRVQGHCLDYFKPKNARKHGSMKVSLVKDMGWFPKSSGGGIFKSTVSSSGGFDFKVPKGDPGAYTLSCTNGNATHSQYVAANGVNTPVLRPMLVPSPDPGAYTAVLDWNSLDSTKDVDLDLHATFDAGTGKCHVFYKQKQCAQTKLVIDGPAAVGVSGPKATTEAVMIQSVKKTVYTLYAHNPTKAKSSGKKAETQVIGLSLQLHTALGKVLDVRSTVTSSATQYVRLACIDASKTPPVVAAAVMHSEFTPKSCTKCPCE